MTPIISVILPTIRPELIEGVLAKWRVPLALVPPSELIVVADFTAPGSHTPWIVRERRGVVDAVHVGFQAARGEYVFLTNDETTPEPDALLQLYQAAVVDPDRLLTPRHLPAFNFTYYGKRFAPFPFASKALLERLGGLLDPVFKAFYSDPDLSMRAYAAGIPVDEVPAATIHHHNGADKSANWAAYFEADRATFRARWDHLGAFCDPS